MGRCCKISVISLLRIRFCTKCPYHRIEVPRSEPSVHLRYQLRKFVCVSLRKTAEYDYLSGFSPFLLIHGFKYSLYGFLLCITDETACVQEYDINGNILSLGNDLVEILDMGKDMFCIHLVL